MKKLVLVLGGGLAGISAASALAERGYSVTLIERRKFLGGRAAAFPNDDGWLDNCQHVLLGSCTSLLKLLNSLNTKHLITFHASIPFLHPPKTTQLFPSFLPVPLHFLPSFLKASLFSAGEKLHILNLFSKLFLMKNHSKKLHEMTMLEWLKNANQSQHIIDNFWNPILISCLNETLDRASAFYGIMVLRESFLSHRNSAQIGIPNVSLSKLYHESASQLFLNRNIQNLQGNVQALIFENNRPRVVLEGNLVLEGDAVISSLPFYNLLPVLPKQLQEDPFFSRFQNLETSPILGIHLWFDSLLTSLPFGALVGSPFHWFFRKPLQKNQNLHYIQLVVSASRTMLTTPTEALANLGVSELKRYFPAATSAHLVQSKVVRELKATFSPKPGCDAFRPTHETPISSLFLIGDWTNTGWPGTMEGAVRSGYHCVERNFIPLTE